MTDALTVRPDHAVTYHAVDPTKRQLVPIVREPSLTAVTAALAKPAGEVERCADELSIILSLLDDAIAIHRRFAKLQNRASFYYQTQDHHHLLTFFEDRSPHALYAMQLWASANGFTLEERMHDAPEYDQLHRVVEIVIAPGKSLASWHGVDLPRSAEPPRVRIETADTWSPAQGAQP